MEKKTKIMYGILGILIISILMNLTFVNAEFWACFDKGDVVHYCNNYKPDWTCGNNNGCEKCMFSYNEEDNCYSHGVWPICLKIPQNCTHFNDGNTIDSEPPKIILKNPIENGIYDKRSIPLNIQLDELGNIYYLDNIYGKGRWKKVCYKCNQYNRKRSFKEGFNNITFKAVDLAGNEAYKNVVFTIDSKKPKIYKTLPRKGFADGSFEVQFKEDNPKELWLSYGNDIQGIKSERVILDNCIIERKKHYCDIDVNLNDFNGQEIEYWFNLTDISGTSVKSKPKKLKVDITPPILNNIGSFWRQGEGRKKNYLYFEFNVTEDNFYKIQYKDLNYRKPRFKTLCSHLKKGICEKKVRFKGELPSIDIQILDKAGNAIGFNIPEIV